MPNQTGGGKRARRASPHQRPSRHQAPRRRRVEHVALAAQASCGPRAKRRKRRRVLSFLIVLLLVLLVPTQVPAQTGPGADYWRQNAPFAHQDPQRSGAVDVPLVEQPLQLLWSHNAEAPFIAGAVMDEHRVYTVDRTGLVTARLLATGTTVWTHELDKEVAATPALASGWLYVATTNGELWALESQTGTVMGDTKLSGAARAATLVTEGRVFQGTDSGHLDVLDAETLVRLWRFDTATVTIVNGTVDEENTDLRAAIRSPPAVHEGRVFAASWNGRVYAMSLFGNEHGNPETLHWTREVGDAVKAAPAVDRHNDRVIVPTKDGRLAALNPATGSTIWQSTQTASFIAGIALDKDQIIARTSDSDLIALNTTTGAQQWTRNTPSGHLAAPILARDAIVQASGSGTLTLLSRTTGQPLPHPETGDGTARWELPGAIRSAPALTQNGIAVVDHAGTLTLIGTPPDFTVDLQALDIQITDRPLGPELGLRLGVLNKGPDAAPDIHVRIERNGILHTERTLGTLAPGEEHSFDFTFQADPGEHELVVKYRPMGATDADPESATTTRSLTLDALNETPAPAEPVEMDDEPPLVPTESGFSDGLATGLAWAAIPGTLTGLALGVFLARRFARRNQTGTPTDGPAPTAV